MGGRYLYICYAVCCFGVAELAAHAPEGVVYKVYQFTDDRVPQMDGDPADWD